MDDHQQQQMDLGKDLTVRRIYAKNDCPHFLVSFFIVRFYCNNIFSLCQTFKGKKDKLVETVTLLNDNVTALIGLQDKINHTFYRRLYLEQKRYNASVEKIYDALGQCYGHLHVSFYGWL